MALRGKDALLSAMDGVDLVFLVDSSRSMGDENKLPLLKGFRMLLDKLSGRPAGWPSWRTQGRRAGAAASTASEGDGAGGAGQAVFRRVDEQGAGSSWRIKSRRRGSSEGLGRVILATDRDFNVGVTGDGGIVELI
ncbi:MAG: hypothetical protein R3B70_40345 [Polyangiaceae bacterium]